MKTNKRMYRSVTKNEFIKEIQTLMDGLDEIQIEYNNRIKSWKDLHIKETKKRYRKW
ncbi:hypothetical protein IMZ31_20800 (plasmid) [Pontibacillus sp. ALD_SL1]|uniref:hypothetical protein n=1 Tax=Pontibacillus sp. ALD_SL1 TaxID=2777185 RepID=UPI001A963741|nr:hypothetical protein [Pontibacillus sp. ALD_SL1]QST02989.1 hypothetical protein IMZ31_20800 [Pontibacillus sp. ALD_SL1]